MRKKTITVKKMNYVEKEVCKRRIRIKSVRTRTTTGKKLKWVETRNYEKNGYIK